MFSYRHAFHAGNHADVLKHAIFVQTLDYFNLKETPYWVIDTHAGAGIYDLAGDWAQKNGEVVNGLDRLLGAKAVPPLLQRYLQEIQKANPGEVADFYPGSPWLALQALRQRDRLRLFEMHPSEYKALGQNLAGQNRHAQRQTAIYQADGFAGLKTLLPPPSRRAIVIIDPSYEDKRDYRNTVQTIKDGLKRFATGCFLVWYPLVQRREVQQLARWLEQIESTQWVHASLTVSKPASDGHGLHGSAMFVINPPWTLYRDLQAALPWLAQALALDDHGAFTLDKRG